jgi:hypothetical protein
MLNINQKYIQQEYSLEMKAKQTFSKQNPGEFKCRRIA